MIIHRPKDFLYLDYLINPLPALAIIGMGINDHVLKFAFPSWITGKLSDFLGMFYFPLLICGLSCLASNYLLGNRKRSISYINKNKILLAIAVSAVLMTSINVDSTFTKHIESIFSKFVFKISLTADITDLWSLCVLPLSYLYASCFFPYDGKATT